MSSLAQKVRIQPVNRRDGSGLWLTLRGRAQVAGGAGGWSDIPRPRRLAATEWTGTPAMTQTINLRIDGMGVGRSRDTVVEASCRRVAAWATKTKRTGMPPVVRISGPVHFTGVQWVVDDLQWGEEIRNSAGRRIRQDVTVVLRRYIEPKVVRSPAKSARDRGKNRPKDRGKNR